jgi:hypothetical protein
MARTSSHEKKDDRSGLRGNMRGLGRDWVQEAGAGSFLTQDGSQRQAAESAKGIANELAPIPVTRKCGPASTDI